MTYRNPVWLLTFPAALLAMGGCNVSAPELSRFSLQRLDSASGADFIDRIRLALAAQGYVMDRVDDRTGDVLTLPKHTTSVAESLPSRGLSGSPRLLRRMARVRLVERSDSALLYCRVVLQEQITETHRLLRLDRSGSDTPVGTAIDRDAASTGEQNVVWKTLRRDQGAERRILNAIAQDRPSG